MMLAKGRLRVPLFGVAAGAQTLLAYRVFK